MQSWNPPVLMTSTASTAPIGWTWAPLGWGTGIVWTLVPVYPRNASR